MAEWICKVTDKVTDHCNSQSTCTFNPTKSKTSYSSWNTGKLWLLHLEVSPSPTFPKQTTRSAAPQSLMMLLPGSLCSWFHFCKCSTLSYFFVFFLCTKLHPCLCDVFWSFAHVGQKWPPITWDGRRGQRPHLVGKSAQREPSAEVGGPLSLCMLCVFMCVYVCARWSREANERKSQ